MKKIIIISIVLVVCLVIGISIISFFYVIGKSIHNIVFSDKNENEVVVEYPKIIDEGIAGNYKIYYENQYEGKIEKIEDNKIYFMVDKKGKKLGGLSTIYKDVEDYQVVFDLDSYTLEYDPLDKDYSVTIDKDYKSLPTFQSVYYDGDYLTCDFKNFHSAEELEFLVGEYLTVWESMTEHCSMGITNKFLNFSSSLCSF